MRRPNRYCEICGVRKTNNYVFLARFPTDQNRCRAWIKAVGDESLVNYPIKYLHEMKFVCGQHFSSKQFTKKGFRLKRTAVPALNLTNPPLAEEKLEKFQVNQPHYTKRM